MTYHVRIHYRDSKGARRNKWMATPHARTPEEAERDALDSFNNNRTRRNVVEVERVEIGERSL